MNTPRYIVQKSKNGTQDSQYGVKCITGENGVQNTLCGSIITDKWYILEYSFEREIEEDITCKRCKKILKTTVI